MIPASLPEPYLVVCEGKSDASFLKHLLRERGRAGFDFAYPGQAEGGYGKDSLYTVFNALEVLEPAVSQLQAIVVVVDSDRNPATALASARNQLARTQVPYGVPEDFHVAARTPDKPPVIISAIPAINEPGNLETLLLRSIAPHWNDIDICLEDYYNCSPAGTWNDLNKQSKMKMQCVIAAMCADDPCCSVAYIWKYATFTGLLRQRCFDHIVDFFDRVPTLL